MTTRDLTAALEERRKAKGRRTLTLFDVEFDLPAGLPAASAVKMLELERAGMDDMDPEYVVELGREILGEDQWRRLLGMVSFDELDVVFEAIMEELMGSTVPESAAEGAGDGGVSGEGSGGS